MPSLLTYNFVANVSGGPSLVATDVLTVEAYERVEITVPSDNSDVAVNLSAGSGAQLLAITASAYDNVSYDVDGGEAGITLDGPHLLVGAGVIALLGAAPGDLTFRKNGGDEALVTILVGRDATP